MISIPAGYIPRHTFDEDKQNATIDSGTITGATNPSADCSRHKMSSKDRSLLLGETTKTLADVNQWTLRWDKQPDVQEKTVKETPPICDGEKKDKSNKYVYNLKCTNFCVYY